MAVRHLEKCGVAPYVAGDIDYSDFKKKYGTRACAQMQFLQGLLRFG